MPAPGPRASRVGAGRPAIAARAAHRVDGGAERDAEHRAQDVGHQVTWVGNSCGRDLSDLDRQGQGACAGCREHPPTTAESEHRERAPGQEEQNVGDELARGARVPGRDLEPAAPVEHAAVGFGADEPLPHRADRQQQHESGVGESDQGRCCSGAHLPIVARALVSGMSASVARALTATALLQTSDSSEACGNPFAVCNGRLGVNRNAPAPPRPEGSSRSRSASGGC